MISEDPVLEKEIDTPSHISRQSINISNHTHMPQNIIVPKPGLYDFLDIHKQPEIFSKTFAVTDTRIFDVRDNLEHHDKDHQKQFMSLRKNSKNPYTLVYPSVGILKDGCVHKGNIYSKDGRLVLGTSISPRIERDMQLKNITMDVSSCYKNYYPGKTAYISRHSASNFFLFMSGCLYFYEYIEELLLKENYDRIIVPGTSHDDAPYKRDLIKILYPKLFDKIIFQNNRSFQAENLAFIIAKPNYVFNEEKNIFTRGTLENPKTHARAVIPAPLMDVCERAERAIGSIPYDQRKDVLIISRKGNSLRSILNEDDLVDALKPFNAKAVKMEQYPMIEQMKMVANARVVIGCHGAGMFNAAFMQKGGRVIECTTRYYIGKSVNFRRLSLIRNISYDFVYCDDEGEITQRTHGKGNHLRLSQKGIETIIDLCKDALERT